MCDYNGKENCQIVLTQSSRKEGQTEGQTDKLKNIQTKGRTNRQIERKFKTQELVFIRSRDTIYKRKYISFKTFDKFA